MATDAYKFASEPTVWLALALLQCTAQGLLIPLLATFLTSKRGRNPLFKAYVIFINVLCLAQTVIHTIQGFDALDRVTPKAALVLLPPVLTAIIATFVHAFFIHRCWRIFEQRVLPMVPFLLFSIISFVSGILVGVYSCQWLKTKLVAKQNRLSMGVWVFSSFALDFCTTLTTIVYLYRVRKSVGNQRNVVSLAWQIMWASAAPPLILMLIIFVNGYIVKETSHEAAALSAAMTAKFYVLSLMVNLVGQGHIRRQFERPRSSFPESANISRITGGISDPIFAPMAGTAIELVVTSRASTRVAAFTQDDHSREGDKDRCESRTTILKPDEPATSHNPHLIKLTPES